MDNSTIDDIEIVGMDCLVEVDILVKIAFVHLVGIADFTFVVALIWNYDCIVNLDCFEG